MQAEPQGIVRRVDRSSLQERVADEIRAMIISGELAPRTAVSEEVLAQSFGVSRTPIREALKQLQVESLVEIRPRVGTFVSEPSRKEIVELFQVKEALEGLAARLLSTRGSVPELTRLRENVQRSWRAVEVGDNESYAELVHEFHALIIAGADNGKLASHYRAMMNQLAYNRLVLTSLGRPGRPERSIREHERILELIEAKDDEGAERAMREHVRASHRSLMDAMARADDGTTGRKDD